MALVKQRVECSDLGFLSILAMFECHINDLQYLSIVKYKVYQIRATALSKKLKQRWLRSRWSSMEEAMARNISNEEECACKGQMYVQC